MRNRTYGGVRGRKTKVGEKLLRFPPTRFWVYTDFLVFGHKKTPEIVKIRTFRVHFRVRFA